MAQWDPKVTTDHEEVRRWAEDREGRPVAIRVEGGPGVLRIEFPGFGTDDIFEEMTWEQFFEQFERDNLALLYQERTKEGTISRFNKLVDRRTVEARR